MSPDKQSLRERLWNSSPRTDQRAAAKLNVLQARERNSAEAAVKGQRWYARTLLRAQSFANSREASQCLIQHSRKLISDSRHRILTTKNNVAFSRNPKRRVN
jgi:hypothetical protein